MFVDWQRVKVQENSDEVTHRRVSHLWSSCEGSAFC